MQSTNGLNLRDDYPQILGDSTIALTWRQAWLLNVFFVLSLGASKKFNGPRINGWECPLLRSFGVVLEPPKGRTTRGRNWNTFKYEFFKGLCPMVVLSLGASGTSLNRSMPEIRFASGASAQALHRSLWLKTGHAISTPKTQQLSRLL